MDTNHPPEHTDPSIELSHSRTPRPPKNWSAALRSAMMEARDHRCCLINTDSIKQTIHDRTQTGEFIRLFPGLYYPAESWKSMPVVERTLTVMRSLQIQHPTWIFTGMAAAAVHGMYYSANVLRNDTFHICTSRGTSRYDSARIRRHHFTHIEYDTVDGIQVVPPARTVVDCANFYNFHNSLGIADSFLRNGGPASAIYDAAHGMLTPQLLDVLRYASSKSESGGESFSRALMIEMRYEVPLLQVPCAISGDNQMRFLDYLWIRADGSCWAFECDGMQKYVDPATNQIIRNRVADRLTRDRQLLESGVRGVTHFTIPDARERTPLRKMLEKAHIPKMQGEPLIASGERNRAYGKLKMTTLK